MKIIEAERIAHVSDNVPAAIREVKQQLRARIGDLYGAFCQVEEFLACEIDDLRVVTRDDPNSIGRRALAVEY